MNHHEILELDIRAQLNMAVFPLDAPEFARVGSEHLLRSNSQSAEVYDEAFKDTAAETNGRTCLQLLSTSLSHSDQTIMPVGVNCGCYGNI